jgi:hypothetical protein
MLKITIKILFIRYLSFFYLFNFLAQFFFVIFVVGKSYEQNFCQLLVFKLLTNLEWKKRVQVFGKVVLQS